MLYVGESFEVPNQNIRISPQRLNGGGIDVKVEY